MEFMCTRFDLNVEAKAQILSPRQASKQDIGESKASSQAKIEISTKTRLPRKTECMDKSDHEKADEGEKKKQENTFESKKPSLKNRDFTPPRKSPKVENLMKRKKTNTIDKVKDASSPATTTILVRVLSAGMHDGDAARIVCDNVDYSPNERGFNVVTLDGKTLSLHDADHLTRMTTMPPRKWQNTLKTSRRYNCLIAVRTDATAHVSGGVYVH